MHVVCGGDGGLQRLEADMFLLLNSSGLFLALSQRKLKHFFRCNISERITRRLKDFIWNVLESEEGTATSAGMYSLCNYRFGDSNAFLYMIIFYNPGHFVTWVSHVMTSLSLLTLRETAFLY